MGNFLDGDKHKKLRFIKMQGAGNDYVYVDCFDQEIKNPQAFSRRVSQKHFGVGSDGVILIKPSTRADCFMDMYNADGSRGRACGNGLRCVAKYMYDKTGKTDTPLRIETLSGVRQAWVDPLTGSKAWVKVEMGEGKIDTAQRIPVDTLYGILPEDIEIIDAKMVYVGNPHCVVFLEKKGLTWGEKGDDFLGKMNLQVPGSFLENYGGFSQSVNVEFCTKADLEGFSDGDSGCKNAVKVRVWERGSGETLACGSGACAVYQAMGKTEQSCCIFMPGGRLCVEKSSDGQIILAGEAVSVFEGLL